METSSRKSTTTATPQPPTRQSSRKIVKKVMGDEYITEFPARGSLSILGLVADTPPPARRSALVKKNATPKRNFMVKKQKLAEQRDICLECLKNKSAGQPDGVFLRCISRGCRYVAHSECLKFSRETIELVKDRYKCMNCKRCAVCGKGVVSNDSSLIHCAQCDTLYHMRCHNPPIDPRSSELKDKYLCFSNWICGRCKNRTTTDQLKHSLEDSLEYPEFGENQGNGQHDDESSSLSNSSDGTAAHGFGNGESLAPLAESSTLTTVLPEETESVEDEWSQNSVENFRKNGHDYIAATVVDPGVGENIIVDVQKLKKDKEEVERKFRQDLALMSPDQCAQHFGELCPDLGELIRKHGLYGSSLVLLSRTQFIDLFGLSLGAALKMHHFICKWRRSFF